MNNKYINEINKICKENKLNYIITDIDVMKEIYVTSNKDKTKGFHVEGNDWKEVTSVLNKYITDAKESKDKYINSMI